MEIETIQWDPTDEASTSEAQKTFDRLKKEGMAFFKVDTKEVKGKAVKKFNRSLGKLMYGPSPAKTGASAMAGGPPSSRAAV